jgi:hypothetical protein
VKRSCPLALAAAILFAPPGSATDLPRGPAEIRDGHLLAQPRLTLPAISPWTTPAGAWSVNLSGLWANSFSWTQDVPGETPEERRFLIDGEALLLDASVRRGLGANVDVGLRVPMQWRGGGILDGFIDAWHRLTHAPDGNRPDFVRNAFRVEGVTTAGAPFSWTDRTGLGLGDVELEARWRVVEGDGRSSSAALVARLSAPTGTGPFAGNGVGGGGQFALDAPLGGSVDLYGGVGFTAQDPGPVRGIRYAPARVHGFLAIEWRPWRRASLVAETDAASRLVENIDSYPGLHWIVNVTGRIDLAAHTRLDVGFTENIINQQTTTDFALYFALRLRP